MTDFSILRQKAGLGIPEAADVLGYTERQVYRWEAGENIPRKVILDKLEEVRSKRCGDPSDDHAFTFIDLFAGIGGLRRGFNAIGGKCTFTCEWDKHSQETYRRNYPSDDHEIFPDIRQLREEDIPLHDVLLAGFPCQPFSLAGVSKKNALNRPHGFACETQGTLFFDIQRILAYHRPKAFLLENVKNLVNHDKGRTFAIIKDVLENQLGYTVQYKILNAKSWLPQHRERIFIVGFREDYGFRFDDMIVPAPLKGPALKTILHPENGEEVPEKPYTEGNIGRVSDKYTLSDKLWSYLQAYADKHKAKGNGFGFGLFGPEDTARTLSARYHKDGSEILISRGEGRTPRRLTPRECARLMGFDLPGQKDFIIPVSDTQAYRQFGNSVAVPAVEAVAGLMKPYILEAREEAVRKRA
ncbi:DNA (cytosine-5-)-methyltransferase [Rhizobium leguminosarum]|uniref:DNA (cytosine-5-)-methyltransferase n=1 Tax=Rhizobium leguminosarum TaxID=384 RepID=UPI001040AC0B|nr:DNA (cytosine-5-)-methyltransferase [Rhizobium leguminosarum]TBZ06488.1 DNA (cytosine-5-)-methyltransferase [Rhizobium leguminosarum bv. viciae]